MENHVKRWRLFSDCVLFMGILAMNYTPCIIATKLEQPPIPGDYVSQDLGFDNEFTPTTTSTTPKQPLPPRPQKPHVVLIVADDLGWNDVSWNNPRVMTPHMDSLARGGVILNQSYVLPTCTPTRAALLTGRYSFTMGMQQGALFPSEPKGLPLRYEILPQRLKKGGYTTHCIGKWHLGFCSWEYTPTRRGFDTFYGFYSGSLDHFTHKRKDKIKKSGRKQGRRRREFLDLRNNTEPDTTKGGVYSTHLLATAAEEIIRSRSPDTPMFLYLPFQSVHAPLQVPKNYSKAYRHVKDHHRREYLGMVLALDEAIGRVVQVLKETGHYDNSVIIFTSDNGGSIRIGAANWPLRGGKSNLLEGGTRGPAFVHSPHLSNPGTVSNQLFHVTDWFSTIVGLAGLTTPENLDGLDQWNAINGFQPSPRKYFVYNIGNDDGKFKAAIRLKDLKLSVGSVGVKDWAPHYKTRRLHWARMLPKSNDDSSAVEGAHDMYSPEVSDASGIYKKNVINITTLTYDKNKSHEGFTGKEMFERNNVSRMAKSDSYSPGKPFKMSRKFKLKHQRQGYTRKPLKFPIINKNKKKPYSTKKREKENRNKPLKNNQKGKNKKKKGGVKQKDKNKKKISKIMKNRRKYKNKNKNTIVNTIDDGIEWKELKDDQNINWNPTILKKLDQFLTSETLIRLYNITGDPTESENIVHTELSTVHLLMNFLAAELHRFVPMESKRESARADPRFWNNFWSPGWCIAKY